MRSLIDDAAEALRRGAPAFTKQNLFHAARRARGEAMTEARFEAALRRRLARGKLPGLLPSSRRRARPLAKGWDASFPEAVLLVDRPAILDVLVASGALAPARIAVVALDGTPAPVVAWLKRSFEEGHTAPVLFLHDAATVVYPFSIEPLATLVRSSRGGPVAYSDIGLPPLGATARRFGDPSLPDAEPILDLEAIPPATLARYVVSRLSP